MTGATEKRGLSGERAARADTDVRRACPACDSGALAGAGEGVMRPGGLGLTVTALRHCALDAGARVLDVGCGMGVTLSYLRSVALRPIGVDASRQALQVGARGGLAPVLVQGSGGDLPLASESVAAVFAECSLSLMPDRRRVLAECWRVLRATGKLVVTDLYARAPGAASPLRSLGVACGAGMTTREELARELEAQGFRVEMWEDHSPELARFAVRLVMAGGSLQEVWVPRGTSPGDRAGILDAVRRARPGYFLLVAAKQPRAGQAGG